MTDQSNTVSLSEYQRFVADGYSSPSATTTDKLFNAALGLMGEAGEVADLIKKRLIIVQKSKECKDASLELDFLLDGYLQKGLFTEEIGDVIWYCTHLCSILGIDLQDVIANNYKKLSERYKDVYGGKQYDVITGLGE